MADNGKRGSNFSTAELKQLCCSWTNISQDPIVGGGQRNLTFWDRVGKHYNDNRSKGTQERGSRSLESKWSEVKHDVAKFAGCFSHVIDAQHSGTSYDDTIARAKELYQLKHKKGKEFAYIDQWILLKDNPRFAVTMDDLNAKATKGKRKGKSKGISEKENVVPLAGLPDEVIENQENQVDRRQSLNSIASDFDETSVHGGAQRPMGSKSAKKIKGDECSLRISAYAQRDMVQVNSKRLKLLEEQNRQNLFSLRAGDIDEDSREYFMLSRARELKAFKRQLELEEDAEERERRRTASRSPLPIHPSGPIENPHAPVEDVYCPEIDSRAEFINVGENADPPVVQPRVQEQYVDEDPSYIDRLLDD